MDRDILFRGDCRLIFVARAASTAFSDIQSVRLLEGHQGSPLPGFAILAVETAWQCHYVAFANEEARESFREQLQDLIPKRSTRGMYCITMSETQ